MERGLMRARQPVSDGMREKSQFAYYTQLSLVCLSFLHALCDCIDLAPIILPNPSHLSCLNFDLLSRSVPRHLERGLHDREGHYPMDSAHRSLLLCYSVSR